MTARTALVAIVVLAAMLETGTPARAQAPTDGELKRLADAYIQAWAKADPKALAGLTQPKVFEWALKGVLPSAARRSNRPCSRR